MSRIYRQDARRGAYLNGVTLDFNRPHKPTDTKFVEAFNGPLRGECLNQSDFISLENAWEKLKTWPIEYQ